MITLHDYLMGRDKTHPVSQEQLRNAADLLSRVNYLLGMLRMVRRVTSGYRPAQINASVGGSQRSTHLLCMGIDIEDRGRELSQVLMQNVRYLEEVNLYMEHPDFTPSWVHLDTRKRQNRIFKP
jgi:uncharacterized protein YcbK (DUF882 family)